MRWRVVQAVMRTAFLEFWRSPAAVFWTYGFPLIMAVVLGFSFRPGPLPKVPVAVVDVPEARLYEAMLRASERLDVRVTTAADADRALARGRVDLVVHFVDGAPVLRRDPTRPEAELASLLVERAVVRATVPAEEIAPLPTEDEERPGSRYIDFLIPGLIGLNLLGAGMWGVGFNLVQMRTEKLLRRLFVTPMRRAEFLAGYLLGRSVLVLPEAFAIALFGVFVWGVPFRGSALAALALVVVGGFAFTGIGCLCASRARSLETIGGLMNAVQLPMWILGGTFFANEGLEGPVRWVAEAMPLTHVNRALRDVMLEPGSLADVLLPLAILLAVGLATFTLALRVFRWQ